MLMVGSRSVIGFAFDVRSHTEALHVVRDGLSQEKNRGLGGLREVGAKRIPVLCTHGAGMHPFRTDSK